MTQKKRSPHQDPHAKREAAKYDNPIPSREFILDLLDKAPGPMRHRALCKAMAMDSDDQIEALRRRLIAMERDGQVMSNRKGAYGRVDKMALVRGRVQGHRDGFGFVIPADGSQDIYLSNREMRKVFDGDEVLARPGPEGYKGRVEGAIVEVLARNTQQIVGRFAANEHGISYVRPDNPRIGRDVLVPPDKTAGALPGQIVTVNIVAQPDRHQMATGHIAEVLGDHLAPGMEIDVAIRSHGIPHVWPADVEQQVQDYTAEVAEADKVNRIDLRKLPFVTIDGEDARDFDDAVYCETKRSGGWRLYVAIADVSHYVQPGSALDREAQQRGNSVYFPDFVVPMLPEVLSNGLCSLNPKIDRLCMVCEMTISASGRISGYQFYEAVMHSHARLTYTQVGQVLEDQGSPKSGARKQYHELLPQLDELYALYNVLRKAREERGAIDFETTETRILFDSERKIQRIVPTERNDAHKVIEECMLAANVCTARFLEALEVPSLYRVHESPKAEKIERVYAYLAELGLSMPWSEKVTPQDYQTVMEVIEGRPDQHVIQTVLLRSMNQAVYQPQNNGHFGLAYAAYTHFTSPIRRYPDLLIHRAIRKVIRSQQETSRVKRHPGAQALSAKDIYPYTIADMAVFGEQCSLTERRADDATRDVVSWLKCEFLKDRVGEIFEGVVSAVTAFGLFVELKDIFIEGLVHITGLPQDYYQFDATHHRLVGERTRKAFRLGDELKVQVVRVDLDERKIDFELNEAKPRVKKKTKVSSEAKNLAGEYEQELMRKAGGRVPRKRSKVNVDAGKAKAGEVKTSKAKVDGAVKAAPGTTEPKAKKRKKSSGKKHAKRVDSSSKKAPKGAQVKHKKTTKK
ncbi:ribonuclease R [Teredinibacter haidensis]|uniref:ribonuclease R n=1 Tax=Teredinibacter haidensis TaxID=2731755 RepID=UPI000948F6FB|nr:ribonuclease R [Teredinibacter haidensis]